MNLKRSVVISLLAFFLLLSLGMVVFQKELNQTLYYLWLDHHPEFITAEIVVEQKIRELRPVRKKEIADLEIKAKSTLSLLVGEGGEERILLAQGEEKVLPIASLSKLMTAWVVLKYYDLSERIIVSELSSLQYGEDQLEEGKVFPVEYLLYPLLMESSNKAAFALANDYPGITEREFIGLMNLEGEKMGLKNTFFDNPSGLDPEDSQRKMNYSTGRDLALLVENLLAEPLIWQILALPQYSLFGPELINTNKLLLNGQTEDWQDKIIGGKTGYTLEAGGCFLLLTKAPQGQKIIINIILGTEEISLRFSEMKKLLRWLKAAYQW